MPNQKMVLNCLLGMKALQLISGSSAESRRSYGSIFANLLSSISVSVGVLFLKLSLSVGSEMSFVVGICGIFISFCLICLNAEQKFGEPEEGIESRQHKYSMKDVGATLLIGTVFSGGYTYCYFLSLTYLTMGDALTVTFCVHFVSNIILECIALRMLPHVLTVVCGVLGIVGLLLICQPENFLQLKFDKSYALGVCLGTVSGISGTLFYVGLHMFKHVPNAVGELSYFIGPVLFCFYDLVIASKFHLSICAFSLRLFALLGCLLYVVGGMAAVRGSQMSLPSIATLLKLFTIVAGYVLQVLFLSESPSLFSAIGAALILSSIIIQSIVLIKTQANHP